MFLERGALTGPSLVAYLSRAEELLHVQKLRGRPIRLIIIDSVANIFRDVGEQSEKVMSCLLLYAADDWVSRTLPSSALAAVTGVLCLAGCYINAWGCASLRMA